ncbi:uncharacterized protein LOC143080772 isoform X2 [Mytilus galloprovincialis]
MTKLILIVLILFKTTDIVYSEHTSSCHCAAYVDPVCSTTNVTHNNEGCLMCTHEVLDCRRACPCVGGPPTTTPSFTLPSL